MRAAVFALSLLAVVLAGSASAYDPDDPKNCNGVDWDDQRHLAVARVTAKPRVNFIKSPYDDDFKAEGCPAATSACRKASYLVAGDLVLAGRTDGAFTCVSYQSPLAKQQIWANGWLPSAALTPVQPMSPTTNSDWVGAWRHPGGGVDIRQGDGDKLDIEGEMTVPTASDFHNGAFKARVTPQSDAVDLVDDGGNYGEGCHVRMQRIGPWLAVEDNGGCGGAGVSFTGLYRRTK